MWVTATVPDPEMFKAACFHPAGTKSVEPASWMPSKPRAPILRNPGSSSRKNRSADEEDDGSDAEAGAEGSEGASPSLDDAEAGAEGSERAPASPDDAEAEEAAEAEAEGVDDSAGGKRTHHFLPCADVFHA